MQNAKDVQAHHLHNALDVDPLLIYSGDPNAEILAQSKFITHKIENAKLAMRDAKDATVQRIANAKSANPNISFILTNVWISVFWDNSEKEDTA